MADTAAFFAKKKKGGKKKTFKAFNANKIDAAAIATTVHVDAPAISSSSSKALDLPLGSNGHAGDINLSNIESSLPSIQKDDEGWEDAAAPIAVNRSVVANKNSVAELLDMNALEERRREQDDVAERMRVEETRAALAAAREGMEKEAQRLKDEQTKKEVVAAPTSDSGVGTGGKWVPVHLRGGTSAALGNSRLMMSKARGKSAIPDTGDAMDFPDLASANEAIEAQKKLEKERQEKERQRAAAKASGIKPWGASSRPAFGGAAAPTRKKLEITPPSAAKTTATAEAPTKVETPAEPPKAEPTKVEDEAPAAPVAAAPTPAAAPTLKKKKKKKDLSTFKVSS